MKDESKFFAIWLARQDPPGILPTQSAAVFDVIERLPTADLISVLYYGSDSESLAALNMLRDRYEEEQYWLDELAGRNDDPRD